MIFYTFITNNIIKCGIDLNYSVCDRSGVTRAGRSGSGGELMLTYFCHQFSTSTLLVSQ